MCLVTQEVKVTAALKPQRKGSTCYHTKCVYILVRVYFFSPCRHRCLFCHTYKNMGYCFHDFRHRKVLCNSYIQFSRDNTADVHLSSRTEGCLSPLNRCARGPTGCNRSTTYQKMKRIKQEFYTQLTGLKCGQMLRLRTWRLTSWHSLQHNKTSQNLLCVSPRLPTDQFIISVYCCALK